MEIIATRIHSDFLANFERFPFPEHFPFVVRLPEDYCLDKGCVIDLETTGVFPLSSNIVTMGVLEKDRAVVYQLTVPKYEEFQDYCFRKARQTQEPRYSYNCRFESEFLQIEEGWRDLMRYRVVDRFPVCARGLEIAKSTDPQIRQIDNFNYQVHSQDGEQWYSVNFDEQYNWICNCSFFQTFFEKCKHIWAVEFKFRGLSIEQVNRANLLVNYRKSLGQCTSPAFAEPETRGGDVPQIWGQWLKTRNPEVLASIALHCLSDLLRERQLIEE